MDKEVKKSCGTCKYLDEYFGDCCHPDGEGCLDVFPSIENCFNKNYAWYEERKTVC